MSSFLRNKLDTYGSPTYTPVGNKTNHLPPVVRLCGDTPRGDGGRGNLMWEAMWVGNLIYVRRCKGCIPSIPPVRSRLGATPVKFLEGYGLLGRHQE